MELWFQQSNHCLMGLSTLLSRETEAREVSKICAGIVFVVLSFENMELVWSEFEFAQ